MKKTEKEFKNEISNKMCSCFMGFKEQNDYKKIIEDIENDFFYRNPLIHILEAEYGGCYHINFELPKGYYKPFQMIDLYYEKYEYWEDLVITDIKNFKQDFINYIGSIFIINKIIDLIMEKALINEKRAAEMALDIALQVLTEDSIYYSILKRIFITKIPLFHYFIENDKCLYYIIIISEITCKE